MPGWMNHLYRPFQPPIQTLRHYRLEKLRGDLLAGLTVAVVLLPQSMAFAVIAGVPPIYGLYTAIVMSIFGSLFSASDHLSIGPTNTQSLLIASAVTRLADGQPDLYLHLVFGLTLIKGLIQLAFGLARMGNLVRYVSRSVIVGFTAGAGILIAVGQLPSFLGLDVSQTAKHLPGVLGNFEQMWPHLGEINPAAVTVGVVSLGVMIGARMIWRLLPGPLLAVIVGACLVVIAGWTQGQVDLVGPLPEGLPNFEIPRLTWGQAEALFGGALAIALLGMLESVAIAKSIATQTGQRISANQEFFSQGLTNTLASFFMCIPGSGSFSRSGLLYSAGGRTRLAGVLSGVFVAVIFLLLSGPAAYIPMPSLAAILFVVAYGLIDWSHIARIVRTSRSDAAVGGITLLAALVFPLEYAIYIGIFLNIALYLRRASQVHLKEMVRTPAGPFLERPLRDRSGREAIRFLQIEGDLFFGMADELQDQLTEVANSETRAVVLRLRRTLSVDTTVLHTLEQFVLTMYERDKFVLLCGVSPDLMSRLRRYGLVHLLGEENVFEVGYGVFTSAKRAIQRARQLVNRSIDMGSFTDKDLEETEGWAYEI